MKPLLKWAGGKRHIAHEVSSRFPEDWRSGTYFEPFIGGGALFLYLNPRRAVLGDINAHLVKFYIDVRDAPETLVAKISQIAERFDGLDEEGKKTFFYELRDQFNATKTSTEHSALMYCLNKLCFNGLYRENSKGAFNVPFGKKTRFPEFDVQNFLDVSAALQEVEILQSDFEETVSSAVAGDFVYFDPPYIPVDATSNFTAYSSSGFGPIEQKRLATLMFQLAERGIKAVLSNSATPITEETFKGLQQEIISAPRMVSAKSSGRGEVQELLIRNF